MLKGRSQRNERIRILQFTDTHLQADPSSDLHGVNTDLSLRQVLARAAEEDPPPDLILLTGDLVHDGSGEGYRRLAKYVAQLGVAAYSLAGNHDDPSTMARLFRGHPVEYRDSVTVGGWLLVFLNSHLPGSDAGRLGAEQIARLDSLLTSAQVRYVLLCLHHHPVAVGSPWIDSSGLQDADGLWHVVEHHSRVRGILWGHIHHEYAGEKDGIRLLGSPSTCIQFAPRSDEFLVDQAPPAYRWLELEANGTIRTGIVPCPLSEDRS